MRSIYWSLRVAEPVTGINPLVPPLARDMLKPIRYIGTRRCPGHWASVGKGKLGLVISRGPEYLPAAEHLPNKRVRCPIHGFIRYSRAEQRVIDHPIFQRLRNIRQLAFTHYVYPGAMHTRFEHSLGVMELASQAFDAIALRDPQLIHDHLAALPDFADLTMAKARQLVRLLGLLHDVGHTAFSHAGEGILPATIKRHELISAWVVSG